MPYIDQFAQRYGRDARTQHVDHAGIVFAELKRGWLATLTDAERLELESAIQSPVGLTFEDACAAGRSGIGGRTGQNEFRRNDLGEKYRDSWWQYHAKHASLQVISAKENMKLGCQPHSIVDDLSDLDF